MTEWVEIEPINGARSWILCVDGEPVSGEEVDDTVMFDDD